MLDVGRRWRRSQLGHMIIDARPESLAHFPVQQDKVTSLATGAEAISCYISDMPSSSWPQQQCRRWEMMCEVKLRHMASDRRTLDEKTRNKRLPLSLLEAKAMEVDALDTIDPSGGSLECSEPPKCRFCADGTNTLIRAQGPHSKHGRATDERSKKRPNCCPGLRSILTLFTLIAPSRTLDLSDRVNIKIKMPIYRKLV
jgi:hypothetical protein